MHFNTRSIKQSPPIVIKTLNFNIKTRPLSSISLLRQFGNKRFYFQNLSHLGPVAKSGQTRQTQGYSPSFTGVFWSFGFVGSNPTRAIFFWVEPKGVSSLFASLQARNKHHSSFQNPLYFSPIFSSSSLLSLL